MKARLLLLLFLTYTASSPSIPAQTVNLHVDASRTENHVSPRMYAAFAEMMAEDVKWGLTAEMIHDRSFEEAPNYLGLPADWQLEPDTRNDNVNVIRFTPTTDEAYPRTNQATGAREHSLQVTLAAADIMDARRGLSQGHLSIEKGVAYTGYLWAKVPAKGGYTGSVTVALEEDETDGAIYATSQTPNVAGDWQRYSVTLTPSKTDRFAKLSLLFHGNGIVYLDQVSLERADAKDQVRADVERMIAGLHPSFLRWPGGNVAQDYHWQWGIGPRDQRPTWINRSWSNAPEPDDLGTDEYLALCDRLHIEPNITVNVDGAGATPEEAAAWVDYVNGPATSKYGALRARNGHPAPYGVRQWELGNEIFGDWVRGHSTAAEYGQRAVIYAKAMRAVDPSLRLVAVGEGLMPGSDTWNATVLRIAGPSIDFLAMHDYTSQSENSKDTDTHAAVMARPGQFERNYLHTADLIRQNASGRDIRLIVNEWNLFYDVGAIQSMEGAIYAARMMNGFERAGSIVDANSISDLVNGWLGGVIQSSRDRVYGTAQYYAVKLWSDHLGSERLHTDLTSSTASQKGDSIDAIATATADGRTVFVKLSNLSASPVPINVQFSNFSHAPNPEFDVLSSKNCFERNFFSSPTRLHPITQSLHCAQNCSLSMPANSVAVITFRRVPAIRRDRQP